MPERRIKALLEYGVEQLGLAELAKRLGASERELAAWSNGAADMPNRKRLALADLIGELLNKKRK